MIDEKLLKDIDEYCKLNGIEDIDGLINSFILKSFNIAKYGSSPYENIQNEQKHVTLQFDKEVSNIEKNIEIITNNPIEIPKVDKKIRIIKNK